MSPPASHAGFSEQDVRDCLPGPLFSELSILAARIAEIGARPTIFPLRPIPCNCPQGAACDRQGKHPATLWNPRELAAGEQRAARGATGYGLATGERSGVIVLDCDTEESFWRLLGERNWHPETFMVKTPRGVHVYLQHPGRFVKTSAKEIAPEVDLRADGGFIVVPGSLHKSGAYYTVESDTRIAECPAWLLNHPAARRKGGANGSTQPVPMPDTILDEADLRWRVEAATEWLTTKADPCVSNVNGQKNIWLVGLQLMRTYELPLSIATALVATHFNPRCKEKDGTACPWAMPDIERTLIRARDHGTRVPGCPSPAALRMFMAAIGGGK